MGKYDHRQTEPNPSADELIQYSNAILAYVEPFKTTLREYDGVDYGPKLIRGARNLEVMRDWLASNCTLKFRQDRTGSPDIRMVDVFPPSPAYYPKPPEYWDRPHTLKESLEAIRLLAAQAKSAPVLEPAAA